VSNPLGAPDLELKTSQFEKAGQASFAYSVEMAQDPSEGGQQAHQGSLRLATLNLPDQNEGLSVPGAAFPDSLHYQDQQVVITAVPDDPRYTNGSLWGMYGDTTGPSNSFGSQAAEAWAQGHTGSTSNVIGVIDTGIDYTHPDLYLNIWLNQREIPTSLRASLSDIDTDGLITFRDLNGSANASYVLDYNGNGRIDAGDLLNDIRWENGVDEDGNGFADDLIGWDFANNDNDPMDDHNHGSHVAGTIGALGGNGIGVVGVNWNVQMVALKFLSASGSGWTPNAVEAVNYFTSAAINASEAESFLATSNSWGGGNFFQPLSDALTLAAQHDILTIAAAGNNSSNNDAAPRYPTGYSTAAVTGYDAVISVASITSTGALSSFSNYGMNTVDIGAPGSGVWSTIRNGGYGSFSGTSMATPHVAGAVALYASLYPKATSAQIREALLASATATASVSDRVASDGRLDIAAMLSIAPPVTEFADWVEGTLGVDSLDGRLGNDTLIAGDDNDWVTYAGATLGVIVNLQAGAASGAYGSDLLLGIEHVVGGSGADSLLGDAGDNHLIGGEGADTLAGAAGADTLTGGIGNDVFLLNHSFDVVIELAQGGADTVITSADIMLPDHVELILIAPGATGVTVTAGAGNDMLISNGLANNFNGGAGDDVILAGNISLADIYALFAT
jgi:subtilisin family serine protease